MFVKVSKYFIFLVKQFWAIFIDIWQLFIVYAGFERSLGAWRSHYAYYIKAFSICCLPRAFWNNFLAASIRHWGGKGTIVFENCNNAKCWIMSTKVVHDFSIVYPKSFICSHYFDLMVAKIILWWLVSSRDNNYVLKSWKLANFSMYNFLSRTD